MSRNIQPTLVKKVTKDVLRENAVHCEFRREMGVTVKGRMTRLCYSMCSFAKKICKYRAMYIDGEYKFINAKDKILNQIKIQFQQIKDDFRKQKHYITKIHINLLYDVYSTLYKECYLRADVGIQELYDKKIFQGQFKELMKDLYIYKKKLN